jgi:hypothetical protein
MVVVQNYSSPLDGSIYCMVEAHSSSVMPSSSSIPSIHMEGSFGQHVGACIDNGCRFNPLLPNSNLGKYFFNDMVKNILISPRLLVEEAAVQPITIPILKYDVAVQVAFYNENALFYHFSYFFP